MAAESHRNAHRGAAPGHRRRRRHTSSSRSPTSSPTAPHDRLLDRIDRPQDLHGLSEDELARVAQEVRELLIDTVGRSAGTSAPTSARARSPSRCTRCSTRPKDKILWDVGHQAYPHKVLTGRRDQLGTIRKYGGLAPFCAIHESEHDIMGAGHASTSIGYGVGIKEACGAATARTARSSP